MSTRNSPAAVRGASRKRLKGACKACHNRKVRCSLAKSGQPCTNCSLDEIECELRVRKSQKGSRAATPSRRVRPRSLNSPSNSDHGDVSITVVTPQLDPPPAPAERHCDGPGVNSIGDHNHVPKNSVGIHAISSEASAIYNESSDEPRSIHYRPFGSHFTHFEEDDALNAESLPADTPMYADPKGACAIANICEPDRGGQSGHFLLPNGIVSSLDPEDLEYLRRKGAFAFPEARVRDDLVRTYFHYIHPFFPILDVQDFLSQYGSAAFDKIGPHLLWSVYLAACNFVDEDLVRIAGYSTKKEMKHSIFRKAKALYDMQYEKDRTRLIQAVLLMSFCSSDTEDKTGPWHWTGVALGLCQTAGLHRNPRPTTSHIPLQRQKVWRLIWWSCVHQDVWFAAGMGRPMRVNLDDCDTQIPTTGDFDAMVAGVPDVLREKYLPSSMHDLSQLFVQSIKLAIIQANILSTHYRIRQARPSRADVVRLEQRLSAIHDHLNCFRSSEDITVYYHACHLELFLKSVQIVLYRPYLRTLCHEPPSRESCLSMERKAQSAAAGFNQTLEVLITADMVPVCQAPVCIALLPPMQVHLLNSTSSKPLIATMGQKSLDTCMLVADELRKTYFGAELIYRLFSQAKSYITHHKRRQGPTDASQPTDVRSLRAPMPHSLHDPRNQNSMDADATRSHESTFAGLESPYEIDFSLLGSNFDLAFPTGSADDAPSSQGSSELHLGLPVQNFFQMDE